MLGDPPPVHCWQMLHRQAYFLPTIYMTPSVKNGWKLLFSQVKIEHRTCRQGAATATYTTSMCIAGALPLAHACCVQGGYYSLLSSTGDLLLQLIHILNQLLSAALQSVGMME